MPILNFTLEYDGLTNDVDDTTGDVGAATLVGPMYFTTTLLPGVHIPVSDYSPRPSGITTRTFEGYLDADGRLKNAAGGTPGLRLWANDPQFGLDRFQYRVTADLTDQLGREVKWNAFNFDAPSVDEVRYLTSYMPQPGQKFGRGVGAWPLSGGSINVESHQVTFQNADGSYLSPIAIPDGYTVMVDNGDGTWSVG